MEDRQGRLFEKLGPGPHVLPGVFNGLSAKLAGRAGFASVFVTGAGVSNSFLGEPDLGFLTFDQLLAHVEQIQLVFSGHVFVDFDAGYGDAKLAYRQARQLAGLGVAGVFIEDQEQPKRCGHFGGKAVVSMAEMQAKIAAVREAGADWIVVARTDARAVEGIDSALQRATAYRAAGADVTFVEAPTSLEELQQIASLTWPQVVNVVEGGKTPLLSADELAKMGFDLLLYANFALRVAMQSMSIAYKTLHRQGDTRALLDEMLSWQERQEVVGLPDWEAREQRWGGAKG